MTNPNSSNSSISSQSLTSDELAFVENMRNASDEYCPFTKDEIDRLIAIIDRLSAPQPAAPLTQVKWWYDTLDSAPYPENRYGDLSNMACGPFDSQAAALTDQAKRQSAAPDYRRARGAPPARPELGDAGTMTVADANAGAPFDNHTFTYGPFHMIVTGIEPHLAGYLLHNPNHPDGVSVDGKTLLNYTINAAAPAPRPVKLTMAEFRALYDPPPAPKLTAAQRKMLAGLPRNLYDHPWKGAEHKTAQRLFKAGLMERKGMLAHQITIYLTAAGRAALAADEAR